MKRHPYTPAAVRPGNSRFPGARQAASAVRIACRLSLLTLLLFTLTVLPAAVSPLHAQPAGSGHSALRGIVLDAESGAPVEGAYLFLHQSGKQREGRDMSVGEDGTFLFTRLPVGEWLLHITRSGYRAQSLELSLTADEERDVIVYLHSRPYETAPVIVTGTHLHSRVEDAGTIATVLRGKELDRELGLTLAATLKNETGLAMRSMGPAPARPVIRGLGGDRVLVSEDGNKTTDLSASSPDHAVTIEPFAAERIEVLRGPRVLTYSPVTIGGVVNVVRHDVPQDMHDEILSTVGLYGESANEGYLGSFSTSVPLRPLMLRGEVSHRASGDLRTPEGRLENSYSESTDLSLGGSVIDGNSYAGASYRQFDLAYGVPGGFVGAHPNGVDIELERRQVNLRASWVLDAAWLHDITLQLSRAYYRHKEFEASGLIGSEFRIVSFPGKLWLSHHEFGPAEEGILGVSFEHRDFTVGGFVFTVPSTSTNVAPYLFERFSFGGVELEASVRYNYDRIVPVQDDPDARIGHIRAREFHTWSASATALYELTDIVHMGVNLSRSSRVPTIEELYSEGPHLAAYSYEVGNPELQDERGIGLEFFLYHRFRDLYFNINLFRNDMSAYILPRNTGEINYSTFLPIYSTTAVSALMYGSELQVEWDVLPALTLDASASYTHASLRESGAPLPQIPPLKGALGATVKQGVWQGGLQAEFAARQDRVDEFEEETAGYVIWNAFAQYSYLFGTQVHNFSLSAENILNQPYRNHLSRVKAVLPEAGFNLRLTYKLHFQL